MGEIAWPWPGTHCLMGFSLEQSVAGSMRSEMRRHWRRDEEALDYLAHFSVTFIRGGGQEALPVGAKGRGLP